MIPGGETDWRAQGRLEGVTSLPLNAAGKAHAVSFARAMSVEHPTVLRSGPEKSIKDTATVVGRQFSLRNKVVKELRELDVGHWAGLTWQEFEDRFTKAYKQWRADPLSIEPPEGETISAAADRLSEQVERLAEKHPGETIAVVVGVFAQAIIRCRFRPEGYETFWEYVDGELTPHVVEIEFQKPAPAPAAPRRVPPKKGSEPGQQTP